MRRSIFSFALFHLQSLIPFSPSHLFIGGLLTFEQRLPFVLRIVPYDTSAILASSTPRYKPYRSGFQLAVNPIFYPTSRTTVSGITQPNFRLSKWPHSFFILAGFRDMHKFVQVYSFAQIWAKVQCPLINFLFLSKHFPITKHLPMYFQQIRRLYILLKKNQSKYPKLSKIYELAFLRGIFDFICRRLGKVEDIKHRNF